MASTNEDVTVLATASLADGRLLVVRHLPDRGTVELGWWTRQEAGPIVPGPAVLELAAEAAEVNAVARLCERLAAAGWDLNSAHESLVETECLSDGAQIVAVRAAPGIKLIRRPEGGELALPSEAALDLLVENYPVALQNLEMLGFGLIQQSDPALVASVETNATGPKGD